ncbi:histone methyltransferase set2 [Pestalotiopsis sp. IQ-011]
MAPVEVLRRIIVSNPSQHAPTTMEQQNKSGMYVGIGVGVLLFILAVISYMVHRRRRARKAKGDEEKANRRHKHKHRDHHHHRQHGKGHSKTSQQTAPNGVELQTLRPVVPVGRDQVVRAAPRGGSRRYSPSPLSKSTRRRSADRASALSSRSHHHHQQSYRTRAANYPAVVPRTTSLADRNRARRSDPHHSQRRAPRRSDPLGWPLPRVVVTADPQQQQQPRPVVHAQIRPAASSSSSHLRPPPAHHFAARELRRTEKFSMTQSERGGRVRDSDESGSDSDGSENNRRSYVSGASSGICDYLKLLNSSPSPAPEEQKQAKRNSKPQLPALGISHKLSFEVDDDKYGI